MTGWRLFFALWPSPNEAASTEAAAEALLSGLPCKAIPRERLHLTLAFLGSVEKAQLPRLERAAGQVHAPRFDFELDRAGYWPRPGVAFLAPSDPPPALLALAAELKSQLAAGGFKIATRRFRPHVTLARKLRQPPGPSLAGEVHWRINEFSLIRSMTRAEGPSYTTVSRFALDGSCTETAL